MTVDILDKAADINWQIVDLKKLKEITEKEQLIIKIDYLPVWGLRGGGILDLIDKEIDEINKQLKEKLNALIDEKIKELEKEFELL